MAHPARITRVLAVAAVGSLALAACGSDGDDTAAPTSSSASASASASSSSAASKFTPAACTGSNLCIGTLLPETGSLSSLGPPEFAGVQLAVTDINAAGGVLGSQVGYLQGDSGDDTQDIANPTVDRLLAGKADVIVGAAASGVSRLEISKVTNAGTILYSPANTAPDFTTIKDNGLYFRTAPSDVLQGRVLGETVLEDGNTSVGIIARQDAYGEGLAAAVAKAVTAGSATLAPSKPVFYSTDTKTFTAQVGQLKTANPDAIVVIGFAESSAIVQALESAGIGQKNKPLYFVDGNINSKELNSLPAGTLEGSKGTQPGAKAPDNFVSRAEAVYGSLNGTFNYLGESYDAVVTSALAAEVAKSNTGKAIAAALPDVTRGGTKCTSFKACSDLLKAGTTNIDYDGISGPIEFSNVGDPTAATIGIYTYGPDSKLTSDVKYVEGKLD